VRVQLRTVYGHKWENGENYIMRSLTKHHKVDKSNMMRWMEHTRENRTQGETKRKEATRKTSV
jgi:hypothetical protein